MAPPIRLTQPRLLAAAREERGNLAGMARSLGCSRKAVYEAIGRFEPVKLELFHQRETMVDVAEAHVYQLVQAGEPWAIRYVLASAPGRRRGWGGGDPELEQKLADLEQALAQLRGSEGDAIDYRSL